VGEEVKRSRIATEQHEKHMAALENQIGSFGIWIKAGLSLTVALLAVVIVLLIQLLHR